MLAPQKTAPRPYRSLFRKYATMFVAVVFSALVINGTFVIWFSYQEQKALLIRIQREQAEAAAARIDQFIKEIQGQLGWATLLPWNASMYEEWRFDAIRLLRQAPALTEVAQLDANGREQFKMSRYSRDVVRNDLDYSQEPFFKQAVADKVSYGAVYFVDESEPNMILAMAGSRRDYGVIVGRVNLKFIWDIVSQIKAGKRGNAYVIDDRGRLIAHPDLSLVLRNTDMSRLPQVREAQAKPEAASDGQGLSAVDLMGQPVLSAYATIAPLKWRVFVDVPRDEAYAPLYNLVGRSAFIILAAMGLALLVALMLTRRMLVPIWALQDGAVRIGSGDLSQRISIDTHDELEVLGDQFNRMAAKLEESYSTLERKVEERTKQLEVANLAKSRFLAGASHDLRQPLHALGLFVGQLHGRMRADERRRVVERIEAALSAMNDLFNALLDISKLDSGGMNPKVTDFPVGLVLRQVEATFSEVAFRGGISLRVIPSRAWIRSDPVLLQRIVNNLVSNAVRYTAGGGVLVGCRRVGHSHLRIDVLDTGPGIPEGERENIFGEFYRLNESEWDGKTGLGLGLAIVERLGRLLGHPIAVKSTERKGSCFSVTVSMVEARRELSAPGAPPRARAAATSTQDKLVLVIDDDPLVLEGMGGLFRSWGCRVLTADTSDNAIASVMERNGAPDLIVSDYHLPSGKTGVDLIESLRAAMDHQIPAFLVSGDTDPLSVRDARSKGLHLLHKPVDPMALRAMFHLALRSGGTSTEVH